MSSIPRYYVVDAFTDKPFQGNPAAVVPLSSWPSNQWMQNLAMEINLSETAFVVGGDGLYELRWFTPLTEVELCGHATLATAHTLWSHGYETAGGSITFDTHSGPLVCAQRESVIELDFPATAAEPAETPSILSQALGAPTVYVGKSSFDYLIEVSSAQVVRELSPDFALLRKLAVRGFIVTAPSDNGDFDFISRFFAPAAGVNEDPVTGSAHCALAPYWAPKLGRDQLRGFQASKRGGAVSVRLAGDRVILGGQAITVMQGELYCT